MIAYLFLGVTLLIGFILLSRWFVAADAKSLAKGLKAVGVVVAILFLAFVLISERWSFLPLLVLGGLPWIKRLSGLFRAAHMATSPGTGGAGSRRGRSSTIETKYLRMRLDHDSGTMSGKVIAGAFAGRDLDDMTVEECVRLLRTCFVEDSQSAQVLETYLDRVHGTDWRARTAPTGSAGGPMTRAEAYEILGLEEGAGEREIQEAYHRLISRIHPDAGGSTYLAAKINQARDVLLGG